MNQENAVIFIASAARIKTLVEHREKLAGVITGTLTRSDGQALYLAYEELEKAFLKVIAEEAKLLTSLQ